MNEKWYLENLEHYIEREETTEIERGDEGFPRSSE